MQKQINNHFFSVQHLSWVNQQHVILSDISFSCPEGAVVGIIGPNGAGKTSLLHCINQQINQYSGQISLNSIDLKTQSIRAIAQKIATVSQLNDSVFQLPVIDVLHMGLLPHKSIFSIDTTEDKQRIACAIEQTDLNHLIHQDFNTLSGGEQQRVFIARALVQQASLLLLDEPTNHLDVYYQHQLLSLITSLNKTTVMTIHDINLASEYCSHILLINKGKLIKFGKPNDVIEQTLISQVFNYPCRVENTLYAKEQRTVTFPKIDKASLS